MIAALSFLPVVLAGAAPGIPLAGTQPGDLTVKLRPDSVCQECHGYFPYSTHVTWQGTMMANAARDPLFLAMLTIVNQDDEALGDLCLRCHAPRAWLFGRSFPHDGSALIEEDNAGVDCDFCHRLTPGPLDERLIGSAQAYVGNDFIRRGPIRDALAPHEWAYSDYFESSELCGLCHDVTSPVRPDFPNEFPIERTYTEWLNSAYAAEDATCQSCHMKTTRGKACGAPGMPDRDTHDHEFVGGNAWMPLVLAGEFPELGLQGDYERIADAARAMLASAARVTIQAPTERIPAGEPLTLSVRVENLAGHKLPTGFPEGRRCWLEVQVTDAGGGVLLHSGAYDLAQAERADDAQLRTYEVKLAADGVQSLHIAHANSVLQDTRIPPRGFQVTGDTIPVGRTYPVQADGTLAHWDDAPYVVDVPVTAAGPRLSVRATLWYQTFSKEGIEFLRDENRTDDRGTRMYALWERYGKSAPVAIATAETQLELTSDVLAPDAGEILDDQPAGCGCRVGARAASGQGGWLAPASLLGLALLRRRKR